jgi:hypothetical protein
VPALIPLWRVQKPARRFLSLQHLPKFDAEEVLHLGNDRPDACCSRNPSQFQIFHVIVMKNQGRPD